MLTANPAFALLVLLLLICRVGAAAPATVSYTIIDLGTLGGKNCTAFAINNRAQVVGGSQTSSGLTHAFLWEQGRMRDLGVLPGDQGSAAFAVNDPGQVVGFSNHSLLRPEFGAGFAEDYGAQAVIWNSGTISKLPVNLGSKAFGIDRAGTVAGVVTNGEVTTAFVLLGDKLTAFGGPFSQATAIAGGKAAGSFFTAQDKAGMTYIHAFLWDAGHVYDLGLAYVIGANALDDHGHVVGMATVDYNLPPRRQHLEAFVWQNGKAHFLGRLPGSHGNSSANGINNSGQIVGWSHTEKGDAEAVLWKNGQIVNLNSCTQVPHGWVLDGAQAINDQGQILCRGYTFTGKFKGGSYVLTQGAEIPGEVRHSFLLTPTINPALPPSTYSPVPRHETPLR